MSVLIFHNPRCSKSRAALAILEEKKQDIEIIDYLKNPPTAAELKKIIRMLDIKPEELVRKKEPVFIENYKGKTYTDAQWISIMVNHPILIERPIVIKDNKAIIARAPELLQSFLKN